MATKNEKPQDEQVPAEEPEKKTPKAQDKTEKKARTVKSTAKAKKPAAAKGKVVIDVEAKDAEKTESAAEDSRIQVDMDVDAKAKSEKPAEKASAAKSKKEEPVEKSSPVVAAAPAQGKSEAEEEKSHVLDRSALVFGGGLLIMGLVLLMGNLLQIPFGRFLWPFIFIIPGGLVLLAALSSESSSGEGLSILGGILSSLGLLFLLQSVTGWWGSWAYAWTLIAPTSVGVSQFLYGQAQGRDEIVKSGRRLIKLGLIMFVVGFVFFELVLGIGGFGLGRLGLPVFPLILIFTGLLVLLNSLRRNRQS
ncbi:MAG: hypothetical protein PWQ55_2372 [Chloroflexota bacterium]|nr:hypothetical protein [Chloroflexota bacterium]